MNFIYLFSCRSTSKYFRGEETNIYIYIYIFKGKSQFFYTIIIIIIYLFFLIWWGGGQWPPSALGQVRPCFVI